MSETSQVEENPFTSLLTDTERSASPALRRSTRTRSSPYSIPRPSMTGIPRTPTAQAGSNTDPRPPTSQNTPQQPEQHEQPSPLDELKQLMIGLTQKVSKIEGAEGIIVKRMDKMKSELSNRVQAVELEVSNTGRDMTALKSQLARRLPTLETR